MFSSSTAWQAAYSYPVSDEICDEWSPHGPARCWTPNFEFSEAKRILPPARRITIRGGRSRVSGGEGEEEEDEE